MRSKGISVSLLALLGATLLPAGQGMEGSGSPHDLSGHPGWLVNPPPPACWPATCSPAPAIWYSSPVGPYTCNASPTCIPFPPLSESSPWFGTPPPSGNYRTINACPASDPSMLIVVETDPTPIAPAWSPIESLSNTRAPTAAVAYLADNSVAYTPFVPPTYAPPAYSTNPYNPTNVAGDGRFHLDDQYVATQVFNAVGQPQFLFTAQGDPHDVEAGPDDGFVLLGHDGYILGRFETPVVDGDGYDFQVNTVFPDSAYGTFCAYGATTPNGPYTLVHSAFLDGSSCDPGSSLYCPTYPSTTQPCPGGETCFSFDLRYFYTPLRTLAGAADPGQMDYVLLVHSFAHTPYLKNDFAISPDSSTYPFPLRDTLFTFTDTSDRFGYPMWKMWDQSASPPGPADDPPNTDADPITAWNWDFTSDPWQLDSNLLPPAPPPPADRDVRATTMDASHRYISPGIFPVCHSVHTNDQFVLPPPDITGNQPPPVLAVRRQSDPPLSGTTMPPNPANMHCKPVTIWNLPPRANFEFQRGVPMEFLFFDFSADDDWLMPPADYTLPPATAPPAIWPGLPDCCPIDGIQLRQWDFESDGIVDYEWSFSGTDYDPEEDDPRHVYPRPGDYDVTLRVCDHDYLVTTTPANFGGLSATWGDPLGPDHACDTVRHSLHIANTPPRISAPRNLGISPNTFVSIPVYASDADPGQTLTLRLCADYTLPSGMSFTAIVDQPLQLVMEMLDFNSVGSGLGPHGPVCFEATDGIDTVRSFVTIWIATDIMDTDMDGVTDLADNCPGHANHDQRDTDGDGVGDACQDVNAPQLLARQARRPVDPMDDGDGDTVPNGEDNCPSLANLDQRDLDLDGIGDVCDGDVDGDGSPDATDNCPTTPNRLQEDADADGLGDACRLLACPGGCAAPDGLRDAGALESAPGESWSKASGAFLATLAVAAAVVPILLVELRRRRRRTQ